MKEDAFENYKNEPTKKHSSPTSPNPNFAYPIVLYQKPQYYSWQPGNYRQCKAKSE
jgi:hypothetical protein